MVNIKDLGLRVINHGMWSDPEIEWVKSDFQTLLFNYWDVAEICDFDNINLTDDADLKNVVAQLGELTPDEYRLPKIYYEWSVYEGNRNHYSDYDYFNDLGMTPKEDYILHTKGQALKQALQYLYDNNIPNADIVISRSDNSLVTNVGNYVFRGFALKDMTNYKK